MVMTYVVDLNRNTVDGIFCSPKVAELAAVLIGGPLPTGDIISRLYGLNEPDGAANCIKYLAFQARAQGIPIRGKNDRRGGFYWIGQRTREQDRIVNVLSRLGIGGGVACRLAPVLKSDLENLIVLERLAEMIGPGPARVSEVFFCSCLWSL